MVLFKVEDVYKFKSVNQLLHWYTHNNPARQKFINLLERESKTTNENSSIDWALICSVIYGTLTYCTYNERRAFLMRYSADPKTSNLAIDEIAYELQVSTRQARRYIHSVTDELESVFKQMGLIAPDTEEIN